MIEAFEGFETQMRAAMLVMQYILLNTKEFKAVLVGY